MKAKTNPRGFTHRAGLPLLLLPLLLSACGGGGSTATPPATVPAAVTLTGTAAAGLPLVGTVTVKDATGKTKSVALNSTGGYTIDVTGFTAPLMLRAEGSAGGTNYVLHSATATLSASGTVNITPLTDLVVANVASQLASNYFNSGSFSGLTAAELDAESAALKAKLLPVLQAAGVDAAIDLMRTPFTPLKDALDKALDMVRVTVDPVAVKATITNVLTGLSINDDLRTKAAAEAGGPVLGAPSAAAVTDLDTARKAITDFSALFSTSLPTAATILATLTDDFVQNGDDRTNFSNRLASNTNLVGLKFTDVRMVSLDSNAVGGALATLSFTVQKAGGTTADYVEGFQLRKVGTGWKLRGNRFVFEFSGGVSAVKNTNGCLATGYEFNIQDGVLGFGAVSELRVTGPALPAGGLRYTRGVAGQQWQFVQPAGTVNPYWYRLSSTNCNTLGAGVADATIAAIPDNAVYAMKAYSAAGVEIDLGFAHTLRAGKRPLTIAEAQATTFPSIGTSAPLSGYTGGNLTISGTGVNPARLVWAYLGLTYSDGSTKSVDNAENTVPGASGSYSVVLNVPPSSKTVSSREIRVASRDSGRRQLLSNQTQ